jgi:hypothetical protein
MPERAYCSPAYLQGHWTALSALLRDSSPRDLTPGEIEAIIPKRGQEGSPQHVARGQILRALNQAGFTCGGKRCT